MNGVSRLRVNNQFACISLLFLSLFFSFKFFSFLITFLSYSYVIVRLYGWHTETDGKLCLLYYEGDWSQVASRNDSSRHHQELLPLFHVQSRPGSLYQRKFLGTIVPFHAEHFYCSIL